MDICLRGESTVSRDRHAVLIYEPRQNLFLVQPGETKELIYLNGNVVLTPTVMKKNDVLQVGDISLRARACSDANHVPVERGREGQIRDCRECMKNREDMRYE